MADISYINEEYCKTCIHSRNCSMQSTILDSKIYGYIDANRLIDKMIERDEDKSNSENMFDKGYHAAVRDMIDEIRQNNEYHIQQYTQEELYEDYKKYKEKMEKSYENGSI